MSTVVVYLGGEGPQKAPEIHDHVACVIAADSGLDLADEHGMMVNLIIGDFDSVNDATVKKYVDAGALTEEFPAHKEVTDFELALLAAKDFEADHLVVIGGGGGRLDHLLANVAVLGGTQTLRWSAEAYLGDSHISICRKKQPCTLHGKIGESISLIPIGGDVQGVTTSGLKWELHDETLARDFARGVSNEISSDEVSLSVAEGVLAVIRF